jgi:hypothetical protein
MMTRYLQGIMKPIFAMLVVGAIIMVAAEAKGQETVVPVQQTPVEQPADQGQTSTPMPVVPQSEVGDSNNQDEGKPSTPSNSAATGAPAIPNETNHNTTGTMISGNVIPTNGSFSTAYPIAVPVGRVGATPQLALTYSSSRGNGICGMGWSLDLSYIERTGANKGMLRYDATDKFMMYMNGRLVELLPPANGNYPRKTEGFMDIRFNDQFSSTSNWVVTDAGGTSEVVL